MPEESSNSINAIAAEFAARAVAAEPDPAGDAELENWLAEDSRHLGAYMRALAVLAHAKRAGGALANLDPDHPAFQRRSPRDRKWAGWAWRAAAAMVCLIMVGLPFLSGMLDRELEYQTAVGEIRVIPLADGSTVTLNTSSGIRVKIGSGQREVVLENGEAFFDVAPDPERPFRIRAGLADVRVVGTKFNLRRFDGGAVSLIVQEGAVDFTRNAGGEKAPRRVGAGKAARAGFSEPITVAAISAEALDRAMVWREGMMFFEGISLGDAIREFKRYNQTPVLLVEPALTEHAVSGYFSSRDPARFAEAVADLMDLDMERSERVIFLRRKR